MIEGFTFPVLSAIIWIPVVAGVIILFMDSTARDFIRGIALGAAVTVLVLSGLVYFSYNAQVTSLLEAQEAFVETNAAIVGTQLFADGLAFEEKIPWVESLGISYHLGVDGLSVPMVLLTGMVAVAGVLISWRIEDRIREFMAFFMLLVAGVYGVFVAVDMFLLFFFYELAIFPMYLLIAGWGWVKLRQYAAMKLTLYILIGSVVSFVGIIALVIAANGFFNTPEGGELVQQAISAGILDESAILEDGTVPISFDIIQLTLAAEGGAFDAGGFAGIDGLTFGRFWFPLIFLGFAVLAGIFPFHNWSPDGHVAAPTAVSMIHAGVLMKLGAYAALRCSIQLMPDGAQQHLPWIVFLAVINVVLGAFIAFRQRDFKYVIGFSSVSHMGLVSMGFATMTAPGLTGAGLQMFSHGAMTALFFGCVGMVYDRAHTRDIPSLGGFIKQMPWVGFAFIVGGLTSMGMPFFSGFVAEYPIFMGMFAATDVTLNIGTFELSNYYPILAIIAVLGIIITAAYVLRVTGQVFFGEFDAAKYPDVGNIFLTDRVILILLGAPLILIGTMPFLMAPMVEAGVRPVLALLGAGF